MCICLSVCRLSFFALALAFFFFSVFAFALCVFIFFPLCSCVLFSVLYTAVNPETSAQYLTICTYTYSITDVVFVLLHFLCRWCYFFISCYCCCCFLLFVLLLSLCPAAAIAAAVAYFCTFSCCRRCCRRCNCHCLPATTYSYGLRQWMNCLGIYMCSGAISAGHDRSDGGLASTLLEMAFAGQVGCGLEVDVPAVGDGAMHALFSEEVCV